MWEFGAQSKRQMPMSITDHDKGEEQFGEKKILVQFVLNLKCLLHIKNADFRNSNDNILYAIIHLMLNEENEVERG